ncbi:MAG: hypothetical protein HOQ24_10205, partial [Mycobacteriaceae bacterium]|nr:hypothetical protein [Mycobacteriaceae bacterium]
MILGSGGSRVLIAGTGSHPDGSTLPDVPAVAATVAELRRVFAERCGLTDRQLGEPVLDPTHTEFGDALSQAASEAEGVLLFYYVGHGIVSPSNELFLATRETDHHTERLHRALPYSIVEQAISRTAARTVVVVLDCCFAGRAELPARPAAVAAVELAARGGAYVLAAASGEERALAVPGEPYTAFSAALITVLREGDPAGLPDLTIEGVYRYLRRTLPAQGLPAPSRRLAERADDL